MTVSLTQLQRNFNRAAAHYDSYAQFQQTQMLRVLEVARTTIPANAHVLDIGCGTGLFAERAAGQSWHVTGLDIAQAMCRIARNRCQSVVRANAMALPFANAYCDAVVSSLCLQWVTDKSRTMNEIFRALKPGGTAIIGTLGAETLKELHTHSAALGLDLHLLAMESSDIYQKIAKRSGFELIRVDDAVEIRHYTSTMALLYSMRRIGAGNTNAVAHRFLPPKKFQAFLKSYDRYYATTQGVSATWQPMMLHLRKPV